LFPTHPRTAQGGEKEILGKKKGRKKLNLKLLFVARNVVGKGKKKKVFRGGKKEKQAMNSYVGIAVKGEGKEGKIWKGGERKGGRALCV